MISFSRVAAALGAVIALFAVSSARADTIYYFTASGSANTPAEPAPGYGSVTVSTVGSDLKVVVNLAPNWFVDTGNGDNKLPLEFNLATAGLTISGSSGAATPLAVPFVGENGSFTNPSFNTAMNYGIACSGGGSGSNSCNGIQSLTFYVLGAGALSPELTDGVFFTADIFNDTNGRTGTVGATLAPVPAPLVGAGLPGLIVACAGLVAFARRRRNRFA